jgi:1-acyl-sn-glycerol-3-phosphate acyltransferase
MSLAAYAKGRLGHERPNMLKQCYRWFVLTLVGISFIVFWSNSLVASWTYVPVLKLWFRKDINARWTLNQKLIRGFFRLFCFLLRGLRLIDVNPRHYQIKNIDGPFVLVANHPTLIDVIALLATYENICCVVKKSVYDGILVGPLLKEAGYICGASGRLTLTSKILSEGLDRLDKNQSVLIFPEGTRSPSDGLHKFQRTAFEMAARAQVPMLAAHIQCDPHVLRKGKPWHDMSDCFVRYEITELPPLTIEQGRNNVRSAMVTVREQLESFAPPEQLL